MVIINKANRASPEQLTQVEEAVAAVTKEGAPVIIADSIYTVAEPKMINGKRVVVVGDGPTLTHGGMPYGAGTIAAKNLGVGEIVPGIGFAVGSIKDSYQTYPHMNAEVPALGYSAEQLADLEATLNAADADMAVYATPVDLSRLVKVNKQIVAVEYEFKERGAPSDRDTDRVPANTLGGHVGRNSPLMPF